MELNEVLDLTKQYLKLGKDLSMLLEGTGSFIHNYNILFLLQFLMDHE